MECPHCNKGLHPAFYLKHIEWSSPARVSSPPKEKILIYYNVCPECDKYIIYWKFVPQHKGESGGNWDH